MTEQQATELLKLANEYTARIQTVRDPADPRIRYSAHTGNEATRIANEYYEKAAALLKQTK
jgi:hypothetical protein